MKIVSRVLATAFVTFIGSAPLQAQSAGNQSGATPPPHAEMNAPTHPGANEWARDRDWYRRPDWPQGGYGYGRMGPWMMGPRVGWMMGPRSRWAGRAAVRRDRRPRGAHFSFRRGNARIDIQCPADQSLKACVDAASTLIDKVSHMAPPPPPGQPKPPAGTNGNGPPPAGKTSDEPAKQL